MSGLTRYTPSGAVGQVSSGVVRSAKSLEFSGKGFFLQDFLHLIGEEAANPSVQVIAQSMSQHDNSSALRRNGQLFQTKKGWQATTSQLAVWRFLRPLQRNAQNKLVPAGDWFLDTTTTYDYAAAPTRRHGVVPHTVDTVVDDVTDKNASSEVPQVEPRTLAFLPSVVQKFAMSKVPVETFAHGEIWQLFDNNDVPTAQSLELIRMDDKCAVVITASRSLNDGLVGLDVAGAQAAISEREWTVTQSVLTLRKKTERKELGR